MRSTDLPSACSLVAAALGTTGRGLTLPPRGPDRSQVPLLLYGSVLACLMLWAGLMTYRQYLQQLPLRWSSIYHDRNAHYQAALGIACELRQGHLLQALRDLDAASVAWPLLHPLLLGLVLAVTGPLPEAAVLPGVLGWLTAGALAFWLVQRLLRGPAGLLGGLLAAALLLSSPALRVMATDVMLESLGLALTLAVLVAYARWVESPSTRRAAWLGGLLAALFLHKYNYWGLTIVALIAHQIGWQAPSAKRCLSIVLAALPERKWLYRQLTHPLHYLILALLVVSGVIWYLQGVYLGLGPWHFEIHRPRLLIETAYLLFLVRLLGWWFRSGRRAVQRHAGEAWRTLIEWAGLPVLVWLALPFRLHYFVWYAGPGNNPGVLQLSWLQKLQFYAGGIASNYYLHRWLLV
ncbi:MAG: hypothetical protein NZ703_07425, partial [Gemmataceae bacterium]|nr:hypothetical protein [Gemmataceae bacterium]